MYICMYVFLLLQIYEVGLKQNYTQSQSTDTMNTYENKYGIV